MSNVEKSKLHLERKVEKLTSSLHQAEEEISFLTGENGKLLVERNDLKTAMDTTVQQWKEVVENLEESNLTMKNKTDNLVEELQKSNFSNSQLKKQLENFTIDKEKLVERVMDLEGKEQLHLNDIGILASKLKDQEEAEVGSR